MRSLYPKLDLNYLDTQQKVLFNSLVPFLCFLRTHYA